MIPPFSHQYASRAEVKFKRAEGGGLVSDILEITAAIPLDPSEPNFDQAKADALEQAAVDYAASRGNPYSSIVFIGGR